jgi:hypothetical protein
MDTQSAIAIGIVLICALAALRSWYVYWKGLVHAADDPTGAQKSCQGCASGCKLAPPGPSIVELKREPRCSHREP